VSTDVVGRRPGVRDRVAEPRFRTTGGLHDGEPSGGVLQHFQRVRVVHERDADVGRAQVARHRLVGNDAEVLDVVAASVRAFDFVLQRAGAQNNERPLFQPRDGVEQRLDAVDRFEPADVDRDRAVDPAGREFLARPPDRVGIGRRKSIVLQPERRLRRRRAALDALALLLVDVQHVIGEPEGGVFGDANGRREPPRVGRLELPDRVDVIDDEWKAVEFREGGRRERAGAGRPHENVVRARRASAARDGLGRCAAQVDVEPLVSEVAGDHPPADADLLRFVRREPEHRRVGHRYRSRP